MDARAGWDPSRRAALRLSALAALGACVGLGGSAAVRPDPADAASRRMTSRALARSIGVNVHETYLDSTYVDGMGPGPTLAALETLGVQRVRLGLAVRPLDYVPGFLRTLNRRGVRILAVAGTPTGRWGTYASGGSVRLRKALSTGYLQGRLDALEMPNEWDASGERDWREALLRFTREYGSMIRAVPGGPAVVAPAMAHPQGYASSTLGRIAAIANIHPYAGDQVPESPLVLPLWLGTASTTATTAKVIATELGWHTGDLTDRAVSERIAAAYLIRSLIWNLHRGVAQNFVYELFDQRPDPGRLESELHYGLVAVTGDPADRSSWKQRPKPSFVQLQGFLRRLRDTGSGPAAIVGHDIADGPEDLVTVQIARTDGSSDIAAWRPITLPAADNGSTSTTLRFTRPTRVECYNTASGRVRPVAARATSVTVRTSGVVRLLRIRPA